MSGFLPKWWNRVRRSKAQAQREHLDRLREDARERDRAEHEIREAIEQLQEAARVRRMLHGLRDRDLEAAESVMDEYGRRAAAVEREALLRRTNFDQRSERLRRLLHELEYSHGEFEPDQEDARYRRAEGLVAEIKRVREVLGLSGGPEEPLRPRPGDDWYTAEEGERQTPPVLAAELAQAWADIQRYHPELPDLAAPESLIGESSSACGHELSFERLLHEAVHGIAAARGVRDTSRAGRYHNRRFLAIAEEMGLDHPEEPHPSSGFSLVTLNAEAKRRYRPTIERLQRALKAHTAATSADTSRTFRGPAARSVRAGHESSAGTERLLDQPLGPEDIESVAHTAEETIEHTMARLFLRLGPPPEPTELDYTPAGSGGGGAQQ